jgi:hypothetical protein
MKHNAYQLICELLNGAYPASDMLIIKPSLFAYIANERIKDIVQNGIPTENNQVRVFFSRIPETSEKYQDFLRGHSPVRIMVSKLKKIKDQSVRILPVNLKGFDNSLTEDDIKKLTMNNSSVTSALDNGESLDNIPHAIIHVERGVVPAFCLKVLTPEKRLVK